MQIFEIDWALMITTFSLVSTFRAARDQDSFGPESLKYLPSMSLQEKNNFHFNLKKQAIHHLLYSTSIVVNFWSTVIYWVFVHNHKIE